MTSIEVTAAKQSTLIEIALKNAARTQNIVIALLVGNMGVLATILLAVLHL